MMKRFFSVFSLVLLAVMFFSASPSYSQFDVPSFGPAPVTDYKMSPTVSSDNLLNANNRGFVYISGTSSHQLNKQFMGNVSVTPVGSPFTGAGWIGAIARNTTTGVLYVCNQASPFNIWSIDTTTGVLTQVVASCTGLPQTNFTGFVYDHTTGNYYGLSSSLTVSQIFTVNMSTGVCTPIGSASAVCAGGITLVCAPNGSLFVVDIVADNLYRVDKTSGTFTMVGPLGFAANYGQDGAFDLSDGMLYLASAGPGNILRTCDTTTGSATNVIGTYAGQPSCLAIIANAGPSITHTPLPNTQNLAGPYVVNAVVTPTGSPISSSKVYWSRNNPTVTDSVTMTNSGGNNWTGNIPGNGTAAIYRYYIKAIDGLGRVATHPGGAPASLNQFQALATDTAKPVIVHTPIGATPQSLWPINCGASVTDNIGVDSVWVRWYKNTPTTVKQFKLLPTSGTNYAALFNSVNGDVAAGDVIYYRIIAQDASAQHLKDSTALYNFNIIALVNACIGTGTVSSNYPFTTYWMDGRTQMLFTAAEILAAGGTAGKVISQIGFNVITADPAPMNGFSVKFQHTSATSLTGWVTTGWTTAYTGSYTVPGTGWRYIALQTPYFQWNGTSNLLVEVCYDNSAYTQYSPVNSSPMAGMTWGYYTDNQTGCTMTSGAAQANRPNTCFTMIPPSGTGTIGANTPTQYSLNQNYPNPFNPVTRINFAIPKQGLVTLKVYDVLGREVKTLVNEVKTPGNYSVDFNGTELSSGVYFYKLESNQFSDIKRMILIK